MNTSKTDLRAGQALGYPDPRALVEARLQLHWAAQVAASVGFTMVEPEADYGHLSMAWHDALAALVGRAASAPPRFCAALRLADLTLLLLDPDGHPRDHFALAGRTLDDGYRWLASAIAARTGAAPALVRPDHELPPHPVDDGAAFSLDPHAAFAEVARWYAHADRILQPLAASASEASPVRCWPHHFDIATLLQYDPGNGREAARSIGVGLSPGDGSYAEPYWYVLPWPPPDAAALPPLDGPGAWHTQGWTGAVLPASRLVDAGDAAAQAQRAGAFVRAGVAAARAVLGLAEAP